MAEANDLETTDDDNIDRFPEGMLGSDVNDSARALEGILARWHKDTNGSLVTTGSSNAYTVSPNRTISAYYDGLMLVAEINHNNTGTATLDAGPGARAIRLPDGTALIGGEMKTGAKAIFIFDNDNNYWQLVAGSMLGRNIDITNVTALTAPAVADEALLYDADAEANRKITLANLMKVINALTAETAPATDDVLALYDTSGSATDKITLANLLKVINALTEDTTPDLSADFVLSYDTDASAVKKVKPEKFVEGVVSVENESLSQSGYVELSNGLIIQWGRTSITGSTTSVSFPTSFPTACFTVTATQESSGSTTEGPSIKDVTTTGFGFTRGGTAPTHVRWIAIGN